METFRQEFLSKDFDGSRNNFISRRQLHFSVATNDIGQSKAARQSMYFIIRRKENLEDRIETNRVKYSTLRKHHMYGTGFKVLLRPSLDVAIVIDDENIAQENLALEEECTVYNITAMQQRKVTVQCSVVGALYSFLNQRDKEELQMIESLFESFTGNYSPNNDDHGLIKYYYRDLKDFRKTNKMFNIYS